METVAAITTLDQAEVSQAGTVVALHGQIMELKTPKHMKIGSLVKVEADDTLSLGEISYCCPDGDGYTVCVELVQAMHHVSELSRLARALVEGRV
jgi:hypothetical protein